MNYLFTGAEFNNKGAEAMTLTALYNIYKNDKNAQIYIIKYITTTLPFELKMNIEQFELAAWQVEALLGNRMHVFRKEMIKDVVKFFLPGRKSYIGKTSRAKKILQSIDIMIDISGFALSSKWGDLATIEYVNKIYLLKKYGAKVFLMPQSFGPFDYKNSKVLEYAKTGVSLCEKVFARETEGFRLLLDLGLTNVEQRADSVLIEHEFNLESIIGNVDKYIEIIKDDGNHSIGIIPNYRIIDKGGFSRERVIQFYSDVVNKYSENNSIYLIAHSGEDYNLCKSIKELYSDNSHVILIDHVMFSFNYQRFVKRLDFIIASRYHAIVHAYKVHTPAIILGWADKYEDLSELMGQERYIVSLDDYKAAIDAVDQMAETYVFEREVVKEKMRLIQLQSCYDEVYV